MFQCTCTNDKLYSSGKIDDLLTTSFCIMRPCKRDNAYKHNENFNCHKI